MGVVIPFAEAAGRVRARRATDPGLLPVLLFGWPLALALHVGAGLAAAALAMWRVR